MPKPRIYKKQGFWHLKYYYPPRHFALFGANSEERDFIRSNSYTTKIFVKWEHALNYLRIQYKDRQVA